MQGSQATVAGKGTKHYMAPEVMHPKHFGLGKSESPYSQMSDVYAFGILLWEAVTCLQPYADMPPEQIGVAVIMDGLRPLLGVPDTRGTPIDVVGDTCLQIAQECWAQKREQRPDFAMLVKRIGVVYEDLKAASSQHRYEHTLQRVSTTDKNSRYDASNRARSILRSHTQ